MKLSDATLQSLERHIKHTPTQPLPSMKLPAVTKDPVSNGCVTCGISRFIDPAEMRPHFKTDWHRYNLSQRLRGNPAISEDAFDALGEVSSIDASSDGSSETDSQPDDTIVARGSPFIRFVLNASEQLVVYKQSLVNKSLADSHVADAQFWLNAIKQCQSAPTEPCLWTLVMIGSGHFAGCVIDCITGKPIAHKTFHRYTTRRKQGGAQSSNDSSKGNAKSAGAGLRRYNEAALQTEVRDLIVSWKDYIKASKALFIRAAGTNRSSLFFNDAVLTSNDDRIRSFPFTTRRATLAELLRCYEELSTVRILKVTEDERPEDATPDASVESSIKNLSLGSSKQLAESSQQYEQKVELPQLVVKLIQFIKSGKLEAFTSHLQHDESVLNNPLPDTAGVSLLHIASRSGNADIVKYMLEHGADPTTCGANRNARPYDVASNKEVRDTFRRYMHQEPDKWDYSDAHIPAPLTEEMEEKQKEKLKDRRNKENERKKAAKASKPQTPPPSASVPEPQAAQSKPSSQKRLMSAKLTRHEMESTGMSPEQRARLDRENRFTYYVESVFLFGQGN